MCGAYGDATDVNRDGRVASLEALTITQAGGGHRVDRLKNYALQKYNT